MDSAEAISKNDRPFVVPLFIPHSGCPHRCVFCDQHAISGSGPARLSLGQVADRIEQFLSFKASDRNRSEIAFYGGNFLGLDPGYREALLRVAQTFVNAGRLDGIRFSTRPDTVSPATLDTIAAYRVTTIEVGVQSLDEAVLAASRRGHTAQDSRGAVALLKAWGGNVGLQFMPGLPGDTVETILSTGTGVADMDPDFVRIYPTVVIRGTVLENWYRCGKFNPLSLGAAVEVTKTLYRLFRRRRIPVARMGLHNSDTLLEAATIVAGPFHPAFGHLVHSAMFLDHVVQRLEAAGPVGKQIRLRVHPRDVSRLVGEKRGNIRRIRDRFSLDALTIVPDSTLSMGTVGVAVP